MEDSLVKLVNKQPTEIRELIASYHRAEWVKKHVKRLAKLRKKVIIASFSNTDYLDQNNGGTVSIPIMHYVHDVYSRKEYQGKNIHQCCIMAYNDVACYYSRVEDRKWTGRRGKIVHAAEKLFRSVAEECFRRSVVGWDSMTREEKFLKYKEFQSLIDWEFYMKVLEEQFLKIDRKEIWIK